MNNVDVILDYTKGNFKSKNSHPLTQVSGSHPLLHTHRILRKRLHPQSQLETGTIQDHEVRYPSLNLKRTSYPRKDKGKGKQLPSPPSSYLVQVSGEDFASF